MGIFDDLIQIGEDGEIFYNQWIEWKYLGIPNKLEWYRNILRNVMVILGHCMNYTALDGCYFVSRNMLKQLLHKNCDCNKKEITYLKVKNKAKSECDIRKFTEYVFKDTTGLKG